MKSYLARATTFCFSWVDGGGLEAVRARVFADCGASYPSTVLRMVPLPSGDGEAN
jgi:hypothetical protein